MRISSTPSAVTFDITAHINHMTQALQGGARSGDLQRYFGPALYYHVKGLGGGVFSEPLAQLQAWSRGTIQLNETELAGVLGVFNGFSHQELFDEFRMGVSLYPHVPRSVLGVDFEIDHEGSVFWVDGKRYDPLVDLDPLASIFRHFESVVSNQRAFTFPDFNYAVYAPGNISMQIPSDLYRLMGDKDWAVYLVEDVIYVIPKNESLMALEQLLGEAIAGHMLEEIKIARTVMSELPKRTTPVLTVDTHATSDQGSLDLSQVIASSEKRWRDGQDIPDIAIFKIIPVLHDWLGQNQTHLHWSDLRKLGKVVEAFWAECAHGRVSEELITNLQRVIHGILGEITYREKAVEVYREARSLDPQAVLLVEGEISTADGHMTVDAIVGHIDVMARTLEVKAVWEISAVERSVDDQIKKSIEERLPAKGLVITDASQAWAKVGVTTTGAIPNVIMQEDGVRVYLRDISKLIVEEVIAYLAIRKAASEEVPRERRRSLYRSSRRRQQAGAVLTQVLDDLWADFDKSLPLLGKRDVRFLDNAITARLPLLHPDVAHLLRVYQACLRNVSADLNVYGNRSNDAVLASSYSVKPATVNKYEGIIESSLRSRNLPFLEDPYTKTGPRISSSALTDALNDLWKEWELGEKTELALSAILKRRIAAESDPDLKAALGQTLVILENMLSKINTGGVRKPLAALGMAARAELQDRLEADCLSHKLSVIPNPSELSRKGLEVSYFSRALIDEIQVKASLDEMLDYLRAKTNPREDFNNVILATTELLADISQEKNPAGVRSRELIEKWISKFSEQIVLSLLDRLEKLMTDKSYPVLPKLEEDKAVVAMRAAERVLPHLDSCWSKAASVRDVEQWAAQPLPDETEGEKKSRNLYLLALRNVSRDLNPSGKRFSTRDIQSQTGYGNTATIQNYQDRVTKYLRDKGWKVNETREELAAQMNRRMEVIFLKANPADARAYLEKEADNNDLNPLLRKRLVIIGRLISAMSKSLNPSKTSMPSNDKLASISGDSPSAVQSWKNNLREKARKTGWDFW